jgi:hypothetical protein
MGKMHVFPAIAKPLHDSIVLVAISGATLYACLGIAINHLADRNDASEQILALGGLSIFYFLSIVIFFDIINRPKPNVQLLILASWNILRIILPTACQRIANNMDEATTCSSSEPIFLFGAAFLVAAWIVYTVVLGIAHALGLLGSKSRREAGPSQSPTKPGRTSSLRHLHLQSRNAAFAATDFSREWALTAIVVIVILASVAHLRRPSLSVRFLPTPSTTPHGKQTKEPIITAYLVCPHRFIVLRGARAIVFT